MTASPKEVKDSSQISLPYKYFAYDTHAKSGFLVYQCGTYRSLMTELHTFGNSESDKLATYKIIENIATKVKALHKLGFIHNKLSLDSVYFDRNSLEVRLSDFSAMVKCGEDT